MATTASGEVTGGAVASASPVSPGLGWAVIVVGVLLGWGWVLLAQQVGATITIDSEVAANALFYVILFGPLGAISLAAGALSRVRVLRRGEQAGRWSIVGLGLGATGLLVALALSWLQGGVVSGSVPAATAGVIVLGVALTLFQTGVEELFFRGWLQPAVVARIGPVAGIIVTALCFSAFHVAGGARAPMSLVNILLAGLFFGLLAWRSGGIVASIMAHFAWNVVESSVLGLVPNPANDVFGSILDLDLLGAHWWGGQEEGLNASVGTAAVLLALIVPLAWRPVRSTTTPELAPA